MRSNRTRSCWTPASDFCRSLPISSAWQVQMPCTRHRQALCQIPPRHPVPVLCMSAASPVLPPPLSHFPPAHMDPAYDNNTYYPSQSYSVLSPRGFYSTPDRPVHASHLYRLQAAVPVPRIDHQDQTHVPRICNRSHAGKSSALLHSHTNLRGPPRQLRTTVHLQPAVFFGMHTQNTAVCKTHPSSPAASARSVFRFGSNSSVALHTVRHPAPVRRIPSQSFHSRIPLSSHPAPARTVSPMHCPSDPAHSKTSAPSHRAGSYRRSGCRYHESAAPLTVECIEGKMHTHSLHTVPASIRTSPYPVTGSAV